MASPINVTQESLLFLITSSIILVIGIAILRQYRQRKLRHLLFMGLGIASIAAFMLSNGLAVLFLFPPLILVRNYILILLAFFIVGFIDSITRDSMDPIKLAINVGLSVTLFIYNSNLVTVGFMPFPNGDDSIANVGFEIQTIKFAILSWIALVSIYTYARIYVRSPRQFRKYILLSLFGLVCIGPGGMLVTFTIEIIVPGSIAMVMLVGSIAYALGIALKMNLAFVLPFRAMRLVVFTTDSGIPLFSHTWAGAGQMVDAILFSGMIQGVSSILKESLSEGEMEEIKLTNAVLILRRARDVKVACVLASTKSSKILRGALNLFLQRFLETFSRELKKPDDVSQFAGAKHIVTQTFPFVPSYE